MEQRQVGRWSIRSLHRPILFGESMFASQTDASKVALYYLVQFLKKNQISHVDCQQETRHLSSLGAESIPRSQFNQLLAKHKNLPSPVWKPGQLLANGDLAPIDDQSHNK